MLRIFDFFDFFTSPVFSFSDNCMKNFKTLKLKIYLLSWIFYTTFMQIQIFCFRCCSIRCTYFYWRPFIRFQCIFRNCCYLIRILLQILYITNHVSDVWYVSTRLFFLFGSERVVFCWINNLPVVKEIYLNQRKIT